MLTPRFVHRRSETPFCGIADNKLLILHRLTCIRIQRRLPSLRKQRLAYCKIGSGAFISFAKEYQGIGNKDEVAKRAPLYPIPYTFFPLLSTPRNMIEIKLFQPILFEGT